MAKQRVTDRPGPDRRTVVFGGQGAPSIFAADLASLLREWVANSPAASLLLSKCHAAFLEDLRYLDPALQDVLELNSLDFRDGDALLHPKSQYHQHGVLEAATLCLQQLVAYIAQTEQTGSFEDAFDALSEVTGFCAGQFVAAVVASSRTMDQFIAFGVEAFRLAFTLATRVVAHTKSVEETTAPWMLVVQGMDMTSLEEVLGSVRTSI